MITLKSIKAGLTESVGLVAQAASESTKIIASGAVDAAGIVSNAVSDKLGRNLPDVLDYLMDNPMDRLFLADAIAAAEAAAKRAEVDHAKRNPGQELDEASWDDILKAAILDLKTTPAGVAS